MQTIFKKYFLIEVIWKKLLKPFQKPKVVTIAKDNVQL